MMDKLKNNWKLILVTAVVAFALGYLFTGSSRSAGPAAGPAASSHAQSPGAQIWTCSMHPQIRMNEPGQCPICGMDLIPAADKQAETGPRDLKLSETAIKLADIETEPVVRKPAIHEIRMVGKVAYDETRQRTISAWIGGRIDRMFVNYTGAFVRKGDSLVSLYSPDLYAAQQELLQALKSYRERGSVVTRKRLVAVRKKLELLGLTSKQIARVESTGKLSTHVTISSPLSGIVVHRSVVEGDYVKTGQPMYKVADLSEVWLELDAYESDIQWVREGQDVQFHVEAFPGRVFKGQVVFVDPILNPKTRTIRVRANVSNREGLLKPDMFVHAIVAARLNRQGEVMTDLPGDGPDPLVVPLSAPLLTGTRAVVYVKRPDKPGVFEGREIVLGPRVDGGYIVFQGLNEGEEVVLKGNFKIDSELQIQAKPSMMYAEGGVPMTGHNHGDAPMPSGKTSTEPGAPAASGMEPEHRKSVEGASSRPVIEKGPALTTLDAVLSAYFKAADALSRDEAGPASQAGTAISEALDALKMGAMGEALHDAWMPHHAKLKAAARLLAAAKDLDSARKSFRQLSDELICLLGAVDYRGRYAVYRYHCPMAFDSKGADWLQRREGTANPYFGSKMFKCGSLEERIADAAGGGQ